MRSEAQVTEARRVMTVCNSCRYCEGLCATFQAMAQRRAFSDYDLDYLANLCHNCTACFHDCQYSPPHPFEINVPKTLTDLRVDTYSRYAWPGFFGRLFERNGLVASITVAVVLALTMILALVLQDHAVLFGVHVGEGSFYEVIGHGTMVTVGGATFGFSVTAVIIGFIRLRKERSSIEVKRTGLTAWAAAVKDAVTLKNLGGGHGDGCHTSEETVSNARRIYHHFTMWGFLLCFASTSVATIYDYGLGLVAPYPVTSIPVLLGTIGGIGLLIGPVGLAWMKISADPRPMSKMHFGMDYAFLAMLFLVSLTGLLLLGYRETAAMGMLLVIHLGFVFAFFVMLPYSKFVHAIYRFAALLRFAEERVETANK